MVRIMTDNAANLPPELREQYNIREICLTYTVDGRLVDGSTPFDGHDFYEALRRGAEVKTSMISPAAGTVRFAAERFSKMPKKKRESAAASLVGVVLALIFFISGIRSCQADLARRFTTPEPDYPISEPVYPAYEAEADSVLTYEYSSDDWPDYDGSGYCWPGQRFELMGMWPYVSSLSVEDDVLIATVQYFPDDAIAPDLVVTLDDNSTITIPCFDAEYPFTYDLSLLSEEERYRAVLYTLDFPGAYNAGGITAPTGDVIRVDVTEVLY